MDGQKEKKMKEYREKLAMEKIAVIWTLPENTNKEPDWDIIEPLAELFVEETYKPNLGCATTQELCDELSSRLRMNDAQANYRTIDGE